MMTFIGLILDVFIVFAIIIALVAVCVAIVLSIPVLLGTGVWALCDKIWHRDDEMEACEMKEEEEDE